MAYVFYFAMRAFLIFTAIGLLSACGYRTPLTLPKSKVKPVVTAPATAPEENQKK
jgi:predicted small lipoprotein YifL